jgi:hypothetical protein
MVHFPHLASEAFQNEKLIRDDGMALIEVKRNSRDTFNEGEHTRRHVQKP